MANNLLIVESPAKSKTISRFLGKDFEVLSSYGHIRDLKTKGMGIDLEHNFQPEYEISEDKVDLVKSLRSAAKKADKVWLASDEDREGEAIAWHLAEVLGLDNKDENRIVFHEVTESAIQNALKNPRTIDLQMVDAQQARRILDRIVGFELSPVLWRKIRPSLSAGRVQSVAVRLIVEREREIQGFIADSNFRIRGHFENHNGEQFWAEVSARPSEEEKVKAILQSLIDGKYKVGKIDVKPGMRKPAPPFTTSTLQQEASRRMGYAVGQTMRLAQNLYEAGHITYMRTDSVNLSDYAISAAGKVIETEYGKEYVQPRNFATHTKGAQEAHEAIRPTHIEKEIAGATAQEKALYDMIRKRTLASQMAEAIMERTHVDIDSSADITFVAKGEVIKFDGFLKVYLESSDDDDTPSDNENSLLPAMKKGEEVTPLGIVATERFSARPARYSEASLVKRLEELGIGRPSTYAPTIQTIQKREYVEKRTITGEKRSYREFRLKNNKLSSHKGQEVFGADRNKLFPTDMGLVVTDFLVEQFPKVLDYNFTAKVEKEFDDIAEGHKEWHEMISDFYSHFHPNIETVLEDRSAPRVGERLLGEDQESGKPVYAKIGRYGPMIQIGESEEEGPKPRFASIPKDKSIETITMEEAMVLFTLPRKLGKYEEVDVETNIGRFGPYVRFGKSFVSIPKDLSPYEITLDEAIVLIEEKKEKDRNKHIATFGEGEESIQILNGRWGPYISYKGSNYKIPKTTDPKSIDEATAKTMIAEQEKSGTTKKARKTTKRTTKKKK